jgi:hypothetical protein
MLDGKNTEIADACPHQEMLPQARQGVIAGDSTEDHEGHEQAAPKGQSSKQVVAGIVHIALE